MAETVDVPFLPFAKPSISETAIEEVADCLRSGWLTTGPRTKRFEAMLCDYLNTSCAQTCASGTAGLLMALLALELEPGDEVITTAMTFAATLNTIVLAGGKPVVVDVDPYTYNIDLAALEAAITSKTRVLMPVHFAGLSVDLDPLYALAKKHNLRVIEDAAHAIGAEYKSKRIGSFGDIQVFSFHPNKNITTGEGGCVTTQDAAIQKQINLLRFHGIDREAWNRFAKEGSPLYDIALAGYKFNFMDMQAALGLHQLPALDGFIARRTDLVKRYYDKLSAWEALLLPKLPDYKCRHAWHLFAPCVNPEVAGITRDELISALKEYGIGAGLHYQAPHLSTYYRERWGMQRGDCPHAERISDTVLSLPLFPDMTESDQDRVITALAKIFKIG